MESSEQENRRCHCLKKLLPPTDQRQERGSKVPRLYRLSIGGQPSELTIMISPEYIQEVREELAARAESVCNELLRGGKKVGRTWQCGGVDGGPGRSMIMELSGEKVGVWHDHATGEAGDLLELFKVVRSLSFKDAIEAAAEFCRMSKPEASDGRIDPSRFDFTAPADPDAAPTYKVSAPTTTVIDWRKCVAEFNEAKAADLCTRRGYSVGAVNWMKANELIGCFQGNFAFPVHDSKGQVIAIHHKSGDGWRYYPTGAESAALVIGSPTHATYTLAFESQWDAFAVLDKLLAHEPDNAGIYAAYITRSATSNTDLSKLAITNLIALPQNDPREKTGKDGVTRANVNTAGRTPSEEWLHRIQTSKNKITQFAVFENPAKHKDSNDWLKADQPEHDTVFRLVIEGARNPLLNGVKTTAEIRAVNTADDPSAMIGHKRRFLGKGGSLAIIGPSGIGKSTLNVGFAIHAAAGIAWHGITFRKPMKVLFVQAENDDGDLKEMIEGAMLAVSFDKATADRAGSNIKWKRETSRTGEKFTRWLEEIIRETGAQLVVIDPLLSFVGDDISQQKVASQFFRNWLQPALDRTGAIVVMVHHTGKTSTDSKSRQNWSESDFAYLGIGSSELTNWARAVAVLIPHGVDTGRFKFLIAKRGSRAGMIDQFSGEHSTSIYLKHASQGLGWVQCERPDESEQTARGGGRKQKVTPEAVMQSLGPATHAKRKDILIADLMLGCAASERSVRERVDALILAGRIHIAETTPRDGGGHPHDWLRAAPSSIGNNQPETSA